MPRQRHLPHSGARRLLWTTAAALAVACALLVSRPARAQEVTGPALTAAYLFNFVKFTTWPGDALPGDAPLTICVRNDAAIHDALTRTVDGREVLGRPVRILETGDPAQMQTCQVLYVSGPRALVLETVQAVRDAPVLTVSDAHHFNEGGGIVQLHVQRGQLRFAILAEAARRARLQISARLMALARQP